MYACCKVLLSSSWNRLLIRHIINQFCNQIILLNEKYPAHVNVTLAFHLIDPEIPLWPYLCRMRFSVARDKLTNIFQSEMSANRSWDHSESQPQSVFGSWRTSWSGESTLLHLCLKFGVGRELIETDSKKQRFQITAGLVDISDTHIKVLQLCCKLQDRVFYTHHWVLSLFKETFLWPKMFASVCTEQKLLFYSFLSVGCYI